MSGSRPQANQLQSSSKSELKLGFGVEIEAYAVPAAHLPNGFFHLDELSESQWHQLLAEKLMEGGIDAKANDQDSYDDGGQDNRRNRERYNKGWWITYDGSLSESGEDDSEVLSTCSSDSSYSAPEHSRRRYIPFEAVSPILQANSDFGAHLRRFWRITTALFDIQHLPAGNAGTHIHVAPLGRKFTLSELKTLSFAILQNEALIQRILPSERRSAVNTYCKKNTACISDPPALQHCMDRVEEADDGTLRKLAMFLRNGLETKVRLCRFMQGRDRNVLWNFENTHDYKKEPEEYTGTVEFRGGRHMRGPVRTLRWVVFVLAFVTMALEEDTLNSRRKRDRDQIDDTKENTKALWRRLRAAAARIKSVKNLALYLPEKYEQMNETLED